MNKKPLVSILVTCYNYEEYVVRCLQSCEAQTYDNIEVIVVDDASSDNSGLKIKDFINKTHLKINYIRLEENSGPAIAKGTALDNANGDYVIFVDCDDWMDDNCIDTLVNIAVKTNADKIRAQVRTVEENTGKIIRVRHIPFFTNKWCEGMMASTLIKRELIINNNIKFDSSRLISDDLFFITQINRFSKREAYVRKTVYSISYKEKSDSGICNFDKEFKIQYSYETNKAIRSIYEQMFTKDRIGCEYLFIKQYYFLLLQYSRALNIEDLEGYYNQLRRSFDEFFPNYLKNKNVRLLPNGDPFFFRMVVWICLHFEKYNIMQIILIIYWVISRRIKFITR